MYSDTKLRLVTASFDETARIWDAESGKEVGVLKGHTGPVRAAAFSTDGKRVVTASQDSTARVWDAESGKEIAVLKGHDGVVITAAFSGDGKRVVTASSDETARTTFMKPPLPRPCARSLRRILRQEKL